MSDPTAPGGPDRPRDAAIGCDPPQMTSGMDTTASDIAAGAGLRGGDARVRPGGRGGSGRPGWIVHVLVLVFCALLFALGVFAGGFLTFASGVAAMNTGAAARADGIVVFTGGAERVDGALHLLSTGHARRLLISGVHPDTSAEQIARISDVAPSMFDCCIDLDRRAANTIGNAAETARWVRANDFGSLIVVTSAYHMPRSLAELGAAMPDVTLEPFAVSPASLDLERWWTSGGTTALLLGEYLKYTASRARLALDEAGMASPLLADFAP